MLAAITHQLGDVAILVNNAGIAQLRQLENVDLATFDESIKVNLRSAFLVTLAVLRGMRRSSPMNVSPPTSFLPLWWLRTWFDATREPRLS